MPFKLMNAHTRKGSVECPSQPKHRGTRAQEHTRHKNKMEYSRHRRQIVKINGHARSQAHCPARAGLYAISVHRLHVCRTVDCQIRICPLARSLTNALLYSVVEAVHSRVQGHALAPLAPRPSSARHFKRLKLALRVPRGLLKVSQALQKSNMRLTNALFRQAMPSNLVQRCC